MYLNNLRLIIICLIALFIYALIDNLLVSIGLGILLLFATKYFRLLGSQVPILELLVLLALIQWVLGPYIDYITPATHFKYFMYVPEDEYFSIVIPALIAFIFPIIYLKKKINLSELNIRIGKITDKNPKLPWVLIGLGFVADAIFPFIPSGLAFVVFIITQFKYIGLIYMFFSKVKYDKYLMYLIFGLSIVSSIVSGYFHDLILWGALFLTFIVYRYKWSFKLKILLITGGVLFSIVTQSIKAEYRDIIKVDPSKASVAFFSALAYDKILGGKLFESEDSVNELNVRLNQGWIISAIIYNVPDQEPFAEGETIMGAISASIVPRILNPDKLIAGGRENFMRFTGLLLRDDTSMGTSILGEGYANYGPNGNLIFMFAWGLFLVTVHNLVIKLTHKYPSIILWLPLIFLQALKAETELVVVLNHIIKSSLLIFIFFWFATKTLKWKL